MAIKFSKSILFLFFLMALFPILFLFSQAFSNGTASDQETWNFVVDSYLIEITANTLNLSILTLLFSVLFGFLQALLIEFTNWPYKKVFHFLFILPLVFPLYVFGFIYKGALTYSGSIPSFFRTQMNWDITKYIDSSSVYIISLAFAFVLSPYVYLFLSAGLKQLDGRLLWTSRSLGHPPLRTIYKVVCPHLLPWIFSCSLLVFLEVVCDFGGVSAFNFDTFSTAVYQSWTALFSLNTAIKLSLFPVTIALILFFCRQWYQPRGLNGKINSFNKHELIQWTLRGKALVGILLTTYLSLSLFFPLIQLTLWMMQLPRLQFFYDGIFVTTVISSFSIAALAAFLICSITLFIAGNYRLTLSRFEKQLYLFNKVGYAIPGTIVGIAVISSFSIFKINFFGWFSLLHFFWLILFDFTRRVSNYKTTPFQKYLFQWTGFINPLVILNYLLLKRSIFQWSHQQLFCHLH